VFAFHHQFLVPPPPEPSFARLKSEPNGVTVHVSQCQDFTGVGILNDDWN
jgi:hypothetical protein